MLQSFPTQRKNLLTALGALDPDNTNLIHFNVENYKSRLPHKPFFLDHYESSWEESFSNGSR